MMETRLAEVQSMIWGLSLTRDHCFLELEVESDWLEVIWSLQHVVENESYFDTLIRECKTFEDVLDFVAFIMLVGKEIG